MENMKVCAALVKAQKAFGAVLKTKANPAFKSRYADLDACIDAVIDALNAEGIALVQRPLQCDDGVAVETLFVHESAEIFSGGVFQTPVVKKDPQGYGGALTYARRYGLMAACGLAPEDDDGNAASNRGTQGQAGSDKPAQERKAPEQRQPNQSRPKNGAHTAESLTALVADGKAKEAAAWISADQSRIDAIWPALAPEIADQLTAAWPAKP